MCASRTSDSFTSVFLQSDILKATLATDAVIGAMVCTSILLMLTVLTC